MNQVPEVPVLSLSEFDGRKGDFTDALGRAWRDTGFVGVRDHGINDDTIERAYDAFRAWVFPSSAALSATASCMNVCDSATGFLAARLPVTSCAWIGP